MDQEPNPSDMDDDPAFSTPWAFFLLLCVFMIPCSVLATLHLHGRLFPRRLSNDEHLEIVWLSLDFTIVVWPIMLLLFRLIGSTVFLAGYQWQPEFVRAARVHGGILTVLNLLMFALVTRFDSGGIPHIGVWCDLLEMVSPVVHSPVLEWACAAFGAGVGVYSLTPYFDPR